MGSGFSSIGINYYKKAELPPKRRTKAYKHCYTAIIITNTR